MVMCKMNIARVIDIKKDVIWEYLNICVCTYTHILSLCITGEKEQSFSHFR